MAEALDERYMRMALRLARKGTGRTSPNPMVGAVVVRSGRVVGKGYHRRAGSDHGEIVALKQAGLRARGGTLYLNLEPCNHEGKTPPCTTSLIAFGIKEIVVGMIDPNPLVSGRGIRRLRRAGIKVRVGILQEECRRLNEAFIKATTSGLPFVILKLAASLDGRIATSTGESKWITGDRARNFVHQLRSQVDAVVVGADTVIKDNPRLTSRIPGGRDPWRIVLDTRLRIPNSAQVLRGRGVEKTIVVTGERSPVNRVKAIESAGARVLRLPVKGNKGRWISFPSLLKKLFGMGFLSVMIEGGASTAARALNDGVVDRVVFFFAPKVIGGDGRSMIEELGITSMSRTKAIVDLETKRFGQDLMVTGRILGKAKVKR